MSNPDFTKQHAWAEPDKIRFYEKDGHIIVRLIKIKDNGKISFADASVVRIGLFEKGQKLPKAFEATK